VPAQRFGLFDLLAPQFLLGFTFPAEAHKYLSKLGIDSLRASFDEAAIVYRGQCTLAGDAGAEPVAEHKYPGGGVWRWQETTLDFRLTVPRAGSTFLKKIADNVNDLKDLFGDFGAPGDTPSEYPGIAFRLELMLGAPAFHLGKSWLPAELVDFRVVPGQPGDVKIVCPKIVFQYEQGQDLSTKPSFQVKSWGNSGFDAAADLREGEVVTMDPPLAIHESGRVGIGLDEIFVDFSPDSTPPEILEHFGVGDDFAGIFVKALRVYYSDKNKDFALNFSVEDVLVSFSGWVSLEAEVDILGPAPSFDVHLFTWNGQRTTELLRSGGVSLPNDGIIQVQVIGGTPPYGVKATYTSPAKGAEDLWDVNQRQAPLNHHQPGSGLLHVEVTDSSSVPLSATFDSDLKITDSTPAAAADGTPGDTPANLALKPATLTGVTGADAGAGYDLVKLDAEQGKTVMLRVKGPSPSVSVDGSPVELAGDLLFVDVDDQKPRAIQVLYAATGNHDALPYVVHFGYEHPHADGTVNDPGQFGLPSKVLDAYLHDHTQDADPDADFQSAGGAQGLRDWIKDSVLAAGGKNLTVNGYASWEQSSDKTLFNLNLSKRRRLIAAAIAASVPGTTVSGGDGLGDARAKAANRVGDPRDRVAEVTWSVAGHPAVTITGTLSRPAPAPAAGKPKQAPPPAPPHNGKPPAFRRLSLRVRLERDVLVLAEVSGEIDFETELEKKLRTADSKTVFDNQTHLELKSAGRDDGVVEFKLTVTWDTSTRTLGESLSLQSGNADADGLLHMENPRDPDHPLKNRLKDIFGALLVFAPVLDATAAALDPHSAGDWADLAVDLGVPVALGALDVFQTTRVVLYGGEARSRQNIPAGADSAKFVDSAVLFDYGVEFNVRLKIGSLEISTTAPTQVRYKSVGFRLHFEGGVQYQPVFDTSKGYELKLADPGLFNIPGPLGDVLKILSVRVARFNPLTLELDLGLKVDLGVVTVDRFKVKWPLHPTVGVPMILPTGVKVDISSVLVGDGHVNLVPGGFEGTLDVTVVPVKIRIAASLGIQNVTDPTNPARRATAVFAGLVVEFPSPIVLAASGLGIFGFSGLFAMHYKRLEPQRQGAVSPALGWLALAKGDPAKLQSTDGTQLWGPEIDRWSFGVGAILGTLDGGFLLNLRGMLVLELPGPRILIFVKLQFIEKLPSLGDKNLTTGILAVVDLDFKLQQLTIGVMIDLEIKDVLRLTIPIEVFFKLDDGRNWHVFVGTIESKVSALILNIVRAGGYFMFAGDQIPNFPLGNGTTMTLPGIAVATGLEASIVFGSQDFGLYLKVAVGADLGVSFSPFFIAGSMHMDGELHLFVVSIEAHGVALVQHPPTKVQAHVCGKVDLFLFSIEGCVDLTIGGGAPALPAPALVKGVYLQSHAPVLTSGQGGDRPIDASLGNAVPWPAAGTPPAVPTDTVPIDTVPVIQLQFSPLALLKTFTAAPGPAPGLAASGGWFDVGGGRRVRYTLEEISLDPPPPGPPPIPATWRRDVPPGPPGRNSNVDLALWSRVPATGARALERSTDLDALVSYLWGDLCKPIAPPVCVLWTFCRQPLGFSGPGWTLQGIPQPDPPGSRRSSPPPTTLVVAERELGIPDELMNLARMAVAAPPPALPFRVPAKVIGPVTAQVPGPTLPFEPGPGPRLPGPTPPFEPSPGPGLPGPTPPLEPGPGPRLPGPTPPFDPVPPPPTAPDGELDPRCMRALQFPSLAGGTQPAPQSLFLDLAPDGITFNTGPCVRAAFFIAVSSHVEQVVFREIAADGTSLRERSLRDLSPRPVTNVTDGLPPEWIAPGSAWRREVLPVAQLLAASRFVQLQRQVVSLDLLPRVVKIQIAVVASSVLPPPTLLVGVILACPLEEVDRAAQAAAVQQGQIKTLTGYLNGGDVVPLLAPATTYDLHLRYFAESTTDGGRTSAKDPEVTQSYRFRTDDQEPVRLDPWVLGTTPGDEEKFHFYAEPVQVIFNDLAVVQLFAAYNKRLKAKLRAADGVVPAGADGKPLPEDGIATLTPVAAVVQPPLRAALQKLVDSGALPCVGAVGLPQHGSYTSPVALRPAMAYTFDVEVDPPRAAPADGAVLPLFRRQFATSRFPNLAALAGQVAASLIRHRHLSSPLTGLPPGALVTATDLEIQEALRAAGEQALPAPERVSGVCVYWARRQNQAHYSPHAILIDAAEPLWRTRHEPRLEVVPGQGDKAFLRIVDQVVPAMEIVEVGGPTVARIVRSPGGTRTLLLFADGFTPAPNGTTVQLAAHRLGSQLYQTAELALHTLTVITLLPTAPWENDDA
jgi:hypothetical protein